MIVGYVSTDGPVCLECRFSEDMQRIHGLTITGPITDPAPQGIYRPGIGSEHYDAFCAVCGWSIRRQRAGQAQEER